MVAPSVAADEAPRATPPAAPNMPADDPPADPDSVPDQPVPEGPSAPEPKDETPGAQPGTDASAPDDHASPSPSTHEEAVMGPPAEHYLCTVVEGDGGTALDCVPSGAIAAGEKGFRLVGSGPWLAPQDASGASPSVAGESILPGGPSPQWWALGFFVFSVVSVGAVVRRRSASIATEADVPLDTVAVASPTVPSLSDLAQRVEEHPMEGSAAFQLAMELFDVGDGERGLRFLDRAVRLDPLVLLPFLREPAYEATRQRPEVRRLLRSVQRERERALVSYA